MAKGLRNFFLLFDADGHTSRGRTGYNISGGPSVDGGMWGKLCINVNGAPAEVKVNCRAYTNTLEMEIRPPEGVEGLTVESLPGGGFKLAAKR